MHIVHIQLTGKGLLISLLIVAAILGALALVWLIVGPALSLGIGLGLVLLVRGLIALFKTSE